MNFGGLLSRIVGSISVDVKDIDWSIVYEALVMASHTQDIDSAILYLWLAHNVDAAAQEVGVEPEVAKELLKAICRKAL